LPDAKAALRAGIEEVFEASALCVSFHCGVNFESQGQGVTALTGGNPRLTPGAHCIQEGPNLEAERLTRGDFRLDEREAGAGMSAGCGELCQGRGVDVAGGKGCGQGGGNGIVETDYEQILPGIVDRDVLAWLEEA
jgi:hypothetical protein